MSDTSYIGKAVKRVEDKRFITGKGRYTDDIVLPGMLYAQFVRSPYAHARVKNIDISSAKKAEGVKAIFTGDDIKKAGLNGVPCGWQLHFKNGEPMIEPPHPILIATGETTKHVGDGIAVVIADTRENARDASDLVSIDYDVQDAVTDVVKAVQPGAPLVHAIAPGNVCFDWQIGNAKEEVDAAMAKAHHITKIEYRNQRLSPNAIEPRCAIGDYDTSTERYTLYTTSQNPHLTRLLMCAFVLSLPEHKVRVVAPDVGGGFGSKIYHYIEEALVIWASKQIGKPIKWTSTRSEAFVTDAHGRDHATTAEMGFDKEGKIVALRIKTLANVGAYLSTFAAVTPTYLHGTLLQGLYTTPKIHLDLTAVFTHSTVVDAYRGAGRPEATYLLERMLSKAAMELKMDQAELRLKNFIPPFDGVTQPGYQTNVALQYDSGNYHGVLEKGLGLIGYDNVKKEQAEARKQGRYIGIGISTYIEACGIAPSAVVGSLGCRAGLYESGQVRVQPTGKVSVYTGSHSHGQGHETTFAQVVADQFGIPITDVEVHHGDTESVAFGMGTYGSRSLAVGGSAIMKSCEKIIEKGTKIAAHKLECSEDDLEYKSGTWTIKGTDRFIAFGEVALTAYIPHLYPKGLEPGMDFASFYDPTNFTYPFGCHIAVVEVDIETGKVKLLRFAAVDDVGNIINPMIVDGQIHGGLAQGIGQALLEGVWFDEAGNFANASYMEYAMPRADDLPSFELDRQVTPCPHNPLGVKGAGEAGAIGSTPAVVNAVADALSPFGIIDLEMPLHPEKIWKAINSR
jgi:carbon-monoxide dehydrogenase large subunit